MPDFWTHILAGKEIKQRLKGEKVHQLLDNYENLYNLGCQGPDPLFYNDFWPWIKDKRGPEKAELIHHSSGEKIFKNILLYYKYHDIIDRGELPVTESKEKMLVYLLGFASHFALDAVCHPFVTTKCGPESRHKLFEMKIDQYMVQEKLNKDAAELNPLEYIKLDDGLAEFIIFYQFLYPKIADEKLSAALLEDCYKDFKRFLHIFYDPKKRKYYLFKIMNKFMDADLASYSYYMSYQKDYWEQKQFQRFNALYNIGVNKGKNIFSDIIAFLRGDITLEEAVVNIGEVDFLGEKLI